MAFTAKVYRNTTDLFDVSLGLRVTPGEGFDPFDTDIIGPQFSESVIGEGSALISTRYTNREMVFPVHLSALKYGYADTKDGMNAMLSRLAFILDNAWRIEWADDSASASTWFDVVAARFEPEPNFRRGQKNWVSGVIRTWVKPFGHTGTYRQYGSVSAGSFPVVTLPSIARVGDAPAKLSLTISESTVPSALTGSTGFIIGYSITTIASTPRMLPNASLIGRANAWTKTASPIALVGASGAPGSQCLRWSASQVSNGAGSISAGYTLGGFNAGVLFGYNATELDPGRNRMLALMRMASSTFTAVSSGALTFNAYDGYTGAPFGPTTVIDPYIVPDGRWSLVDLGVIYNGTTILETTLTRIIIVGYDYKANLAAAAGTTVTTTFECGGLAFLPEDTTYLISDTISGSYIAKNFSVATYTLSDEVVGAAYCGSTNGVAAVALVGQEARGNRSTLPPAPTAAVQGVDARYITAFAFSALGPQNGALGVDVKIQERFTFQR